jgi:nucleotide-binding universal stress UspA family protein
MNGKMRVLVATDGSACSEAAVDEIARRPWPENTEVKVVSVIEPPAALAAGEWEVPNYLDELERAQTDHAKDALKDAVERLGAAPGGPLTVTAELLHGSAKRVIVEEAEAWGADLIVVGSHGYNRFERLLMGSVSQAVASHARCSVEIARSVGTPPGSAA